LLRNVSKRKLAQDVYTVLIEHTDMLPRLNPASGVPLYLQLIEHVKHAIETGTIRAGEQLPSVRQMAEALLINPNTVARAYRELEHEGIIELKHGSGAFIRDSIAPRQKLMQKARSVVISALDELESFDLSEDEIRRLLENELASRRTRKKRRKTYA
jgi:GntR family transcriptional regulator